MKYLLSVKKLLIVAALTLMCNLARAQDYVKINYRIDSLLQLGLPKSALAEVDKLEAAAIADKNVPQQINAAIYRMTFQSYIEENALLAIIERLKLDISKAQYPVKPVLQSILASMYYNYYQQNRWQFANRTRQEKPSGDITLWDLQTIINQTSAMYRASLSDAAREQDTPIEVLDGVLTGDPSTRVLRPSFYDFLVQRALEFFLLDEPALTRPRLPFSVKDARFFGDSKAFSALAVNTTDTASTYYFGIQYLQQATRFHLTRHDDQALADLDIKRLEFLYSNATLPNKDTLYLTALKQIATTFADKPISADALVNVGKYYQQKNALSAALVYLQKAFDAYPTSFGGRNAEILINQIKQKDLNLTVENLNVPATPILASLNYRNVPAVKVAIYHLTEQEEQLYLTERTKFSLKYRIPEMSGWLTNFLKKKIPVQEKNLQLPDLHDYGTHRTEFKIDALPPGNYLGVISNAPLADSAITSYIDFKVSRLSVVSRGLPDNTSEVRVMDRLTGKPISGAQVKTEIRNNNGSRDAINGVTDNAGKFSAGASNGALEVTVMAKGDTLSDITAYVYGQRDNNQNDDPDDKTVVFTDRQIYRPGQTIYYKALQLLVYKHRSVLQPLKTITINFKDANDKLISSITQTTNSFGSVAGTFSIPQNIINGEAELGTDDGRISIRIEEYKRPTFEVAMPAVKESYKLNDSVKVKGTVTAFSGYGLSKARVAYHITRSQSYLSYRFGGVYNYNNTLAEIKTDTIKTDDQGNFLIRFKAIPGDAANLNNIVYQYNINADVLDASGETHSASTMVNVGNNNIVINTSPPQEILAKDTSHVFAGINNLNGQPLKGTIRVKVYALENPAQLYKNRLWATPDQFLMSEAEFKASFADYPYRKEDDQNTWKRLNQLGDTSFAANDIKRSYFNFKALSRQPSAVYQLVISARTEKGDTASVIRYVHLVANPARPSTFNGWVVPLLNGVKPGQSADFLVGTGTACNVLIEKYEGSRIFSSQWVYIGTGQQHIKIPVGLRDSDIKVQFMMVYKNRMYSSYQPIYITRPDNDLDIKMVSYHDRLQPGQKDQWKLQVTMPGDKKQTAEMVASMYDASLDALSSPANWQGALDFNQGYQPNYFNWVSYDFVAQSQSRPLVNSRRFYNGLITRNYEHLEMFGYNYYGGYNGGFHTYQNSNRSRLSSQIRDNQLAAQYQSNAALVKDGIDITGRVVDDGEPLIGVTVKIKGTNIAISTNSLGYFKIRVLPNSVLVFNFIGYNTKEVTITKNTSINVAMVPSAASLNEVSVVGYGSVSRKDVTGAVGSISTIRVNGKAFDNSLQGRLAGVKISEDTTEYKAMAYKVRAQNLPADVIQNLQLIDDYGDQANLAGKRPIATRSNFSESAFFYPQLLTNAKGEVLIDITMPESLTKWKFRVFAHTTDLQSGYLQTEIVTQKQLSINANTPRFLREGDTITISARLANLTAGTIRGKVNLQLLNAVNMQPVNLLTNPAEAEQNFSLATASTKAVSFRMVIPAGLSALTYKLTADGGQYTDGEENTIPVLPNRMLVTESMPMMVRGGQTRDYTFDKLVNQHSATLNNKTLTLEYTQNPAWYAVQALPYMMEFPYECSEQVFSRYYANSMGTGLVSKMPVIKQVFDRWKATNSMELLSNLEKNQSLKLTLLEETPWLRDAASEDEQKKRIALLFDLNKMSYELQLNLDKLRDKQLSDGGFPWFGGDRSDAYITRHILAGIGQLYHLGIADTKNLELKAIADKAMSYLDNDLIDKADWAKKHKAYEGRILGSEEIHAYYTQSYFTARTMPEAVKPLLANYLALAANQWRLNGVYEQALIALTMLRNNKPDVAQTIINSLKETAQNSDEMGMYWGKNQLGYYWYQSPIETQSLMIELFTEVGNNAKAVEDMKIWLLREKQTTNWKTTKATAAACYALLLRGDNWLADTAKSVIKLDGKLLTDLKPDVKAEEGTGYLKTTWVDEQVKPGLGKVTIVNNGKTISWGALHWQYLENLDKITPSNTDIHLERKYFIQKQTDAGAVLTAVDASHQPKTGDLLKVVVYLKAGRDYEYVQLKDMRPAGTEPVDILSSYKYQDGLWYYQVTKDVATNFFISNLYKGNYVFEYRLRVAQPGNFSTGISSVQCMYAPEFNAHSEGTRMVIKP